MPDKTLVRGDDYDINRPVFRHTLVLRNGNPMNLTNTKTYTTFKTVKTDPATDPDDTTPTGNAVIKGELVVDASGVATTEDKLFLVGDAVAGIIDLRLTAAETLALPLGGGWSSDVVVIDENGKITTFIQPDKLFTEDGYTNREEV